MAEFDDPVMIVVGGGAVALSTAQELCALQGHRVVVLWRRDPEVARAVKNIGADETNSAPACEMRSQSSHCHRTTSSTSTRRCLRATPIRGSGSFCGSSTERLVTR